MSAVPTTNRPTTTGFRHQLLPWIVGILATTFPLVMSSNTVWNWVGKLFAWVPPHPSAALTVLLIPITWSLGLLGFFGYVVGTGILTWCAGRLMLRHRKSFIPPVLLVPLLCDIYIFVQVLPLFELPYGAQIRPGGGDRNDLSAGIWPDHLLHVLCREATAGTGKQNHLHPRHTDRFVTNTDHAAFAAISCGH